MYKNVFLLKNVVKSLDVFIFQANMDYIYFLIKPKRTKNEQLCSKSNE